MREHIKESNLIEGVDSRKSDGHSFAAWLWLTQQEELTHEVICGLHGMIMKGLLNPELRGVYRQDSREVGGRMTPHHDYVEGLMQNYLYDMKVSDDPTSMHVRYEYIHPFVDGNGRTGRMLLWWHQMKLGQEPTLYKASEREEYYKLFEGLGNGPSLMP